MARIPANALAAYDAGKLSDEEIDSLFQNMVDSGQIWYEKADSDVYIRQAAKLIRLGRIVPPKYEVAINEEDVEHGGD